MKNLFYILVTLLFTAKLSAQMLPNETLSPSGIFDKIYDRFGNEYTLSTLKVKKVITGDRSANLCSAGYFDLYFEANSGMTGSAPVEIARRNVICQVFTDLSELIVPANPNTRVNIWVRDISSIIQNPANVGVLGLASSYYSLPVNAPAYSGIIDNEIWKTINSGTDSYTNVTSPMISNDSPNPAFYHGMIAFNFSNPFISWHTDLSQTTASGLYDMYTVALHEITHALGFTSLIDADGTSKLGANNYYSRFDTFLKTTTNQFLITNTGSCALYNFQFNPALNPSILTPSNSNCTNHIEFTGSVNQAVYSPSTFASASSLSHLEDICHVPNAHPDNEYYVMSDANPTGANAMKRYLKSEERKVLCDLGYHVNATYGNASNLNFFNYSGGICAGIQVAGINDGIDANGAFQHVVSVNSTITLNANDILQNDFNAVTFECLEDIYGHGTPNTTSGTSFTFNATSPGLALLRYIPVSATGQRGNISYIFIYAQDGNCTTSACDIVNNGGVENGINCTALNMLPNCSNNPQIYCWTTLSGTPDYFVRGCMDTMCNYAYPTHGTVPSTLSSPAIETWTNGNSNAPNDKFLGFGSINYSPTTLNESIQVSLQTPLQPNTPYTLKFVGRVVANTQYKYDDVPGVIDISGSTGLLAPISYFFNATPSALTPLTQITIPNNDTWNSFELTIINTSNSPLSYLTLINAGYLNNNPTGTRSYTIIDNLSITEPSEIGVLNLPDSTCIHGDISDLSFYLSPAPPGGDFSGNGVTTNGSDYSLDAALAGFGSHEIAYTYETNLGCTITIYDTIVVYDSEIEMLNLPDSICIHNEISDLSFYLSSPVLAGYFSGNGIVTNGSDYGLDASLAGSGSHEIAFTYETNLGCNITIYDTIVVYYLGCEGAVINNKMTDYGITIYHDISRNQFTVEKPSDLSQEVQIKIIDINSKLILEDVMPISEQKAVIDISQHSKGIYFFKFIINGDVFVKQIIK